MAGLELVKLNYKGVFGILIVNSLVRVRMDGPIITLRFHSKTMSVDQLSSVLGAEPTRGFDVGTPLTNSRNDQRCREETLWLIERRFPSGSRLEDCLNQQLQFLENREAVITKLNPRVTIDLFCAAPVDVERYALSFCLDNQMLQRIANLRLDLLMDIIPDQPNK